VIGVPKQIAIVSGKGGTGKTTVAASISFFAKRAVIADCDVDASNLSLVLSGVVRNKETFMGSSKASIDLSLCTRCDECEKNCRFVAIHDLHVDQMLCEGCGVCKLVCPSEAVELCEVESGTIRVSDTLYGTLVDAEMIPGEANSGKLVARVREIAWNELVMQNGALMIIDGPPGTGCPVISSITGVDLVLAVTEPTPSGLHDLRRVMDLAKHFGLPTAVIINKADLNPQITKDVIDTCKRSGNEMLGAVPYDEKVSEAIVEGLPFPAYSPHADAAIALQEAWKVLEQHMAALPEKKGFVRIE
jgi:MinD superfamily P-loop ATPase